LGLEGGAKREEASCQAGGGKRGRQLTAVGKKVKGEITAMEKSPDQKTCANPFGSDAKVQGKEEKKTLST